MDLLRQVAMNRAAKGVPEPPLPKPQGTTKKERTMKYKPGSKLMRSHIIEEKPSKKAVKEHLEALIDREVSKTLDSESDDE